MGKTVGNGWNMSENFEARLEREDMWRRLYSLAFRMLHDREEAEDVCQETIIKAFAAYDRFDPAIGTFQSWMFRICRNEAINKMSRRHPTLSIDAIENGDEVAVASDSLLHSTADRIALAQIMPSLEPEERKLLLLCHIEQLPQEQVAEILNIPVGTVKSRLHSLRGKLRLMLASFGFMA